MPTASAQPERLSIVCISPQEWEADLPTNRQQIMLRVARDGHRVLFIESGSFLWRDARRIGRNPLKEMRRRLAGRQVADGFDARSALNLVPWGKRSRLASRINFQATGWLLRRALAKLPEPVVLWLYDPCGFALIGSVGEALAVYDCVDDYPEQYAASDRSRMLVADADREAGRRSRIVFATTEALAARHQEANERTYLVPNGADYSHFAPAADPALATPELANLPRPVIGFAGNLTPDKVDFDLLTTLASDHPEWTLVLVGPARKGAEGELEALEELANVVWLGWKPYAELPRYVAAFDVGLCPYVSTAYTTNVFPLKVYEYLAAGKPVVATGTPTLAGMAPDVVLASGPASLADAIEAALSRAGSEDRIRRMELAAKNTWDQRTERLLGLIAAELGSRGRGKEP